MSRLNKNLFFVIIIFITIFLLFANISFAQTNLRNLSISDIEDKAKVAYAIKNYDEAILLYNELITRDYKNHEYLNNLGLCYFQSKNYIKAKENFRLAVLYSEKNATYYTNLSAAFCKLDEDEKAYDYARKAYDIEETEFTLFNAASFANVIKRFDLCLDLLRKSNIEKNNDFNILYAEAYFLKGDIEKSIYHYELYLQNYNANTSSEEYYNQKYHYFKGLMNNFERNVTEKNNFENYLPKIDSLYFNLNNSPQQDKTNKKTINTIRTILRIDTTYNTYFTNMIEKVSDLGLHKGELLYFTKNYDKAISYITAMEMQDVESIKLLFASYLAKYAEQKDKTIEEKIEEIYLNKNSRKDEEFIDFAIDLMGETLKQQPSCKNFFFSLLDKTDESLFHKITISDIKKKLDQINK